MTTPTHATRVTTIAGLVLALTACSTVGTGGDEAADSDQGGQNGKSGEVVLLTHDSFALPKTLIKQFETDSGYDLTVRQVGDAGELTSSLVLTQGSPDGDVAYGVDNTFAGEAVSANVFAPYDVELPAGADNYLLEGDGSDVLAPVDTASVCVNVDKQWFAKEGLRPPRTLDDLTKPAYQDLFVTPGATTSSPGFAFLLATIAAKGDGWQDYWQALMGNGTKIVRGWEDAYYVDFTAGGGKNPTRPIVVSYDSSPAFTIDKRTGRSTTAALLDTCFRQVEYAGVLEGAENPDGANALIQFMTSKEVQAALPTSMYVFPVRDGVTLPPDWAKHARQPTDTLQVSPEEIDSNREQWLTEWRDITTQ